MAKPVKTDRVIRRCVIYTRKSSEEGLEQEFNSLHAQREACEAYIKSQAHEGWKLVPTAYNDGGISGGTMERPGLKALLEDIAKSAIDTVVVYKVDRLTRSLADFAKMVEIFDRHHISFVAVTQQFNTTTSMGRLTLNVLLSFAQFEREVTGERIRDKIAASKRKGMWMGGFVPLGYEGKDRTLVINPQEAETVRMIFRRYNELNSVQSLKHDLDRNGIVTKIRISAAGRTYGGKPISMGNLYQMLANPLYIGQIRHQGICHPGLHEAIIDQTLWAETQSRLERNRQGTMMRRNSNASAPLLGKLFDESGERLIPTHAQKRGQRYRYYISPFLIRRDPSETRKGWRIPASELEDKISAAISTLLLDQTALAETWRKNDLPFNQFQSVQEAIRVVPPQPLDLIERLEIAPNNLKATLLLKEGVTLTHHIPMSIRRCGQEMRLILDHEQRQVDPALLSSIARGHRWFGELADGHIAGLSDIAERESLSKGRISRLMRLAFLSPKIIQAIIDGRQPGNLTARTFTNLETIPVQWSEQETLLGF